MPQARSVEPQQAIGVSLCSLQLKARQALFRRIANFVGKRMKQRLQITDMPLGAVLSPPIPAISERLNQCDIHAEISGPVSPLGWSVQITVVVRSPWNAKRLRKNCTVETAGKHKIRSGDTPHSAPQIVGLYAVTDMPVEDVNGGF